MYALSYRIFIKISYCCYHEFFPVIYNQIGICSYNFYPGRLYFWGHSLLTYIIVMPIGRINSREISTVISHITVNILLKRTNMLLFAPSATSDINLVSLHETLQLLLSYISCSEHIIIIIIVIIRHDGNIWRIDSSIKEWKIFISILCPCTSNYNYMRILYPQLEEYRLKMLFLNYISVNK